MELNWELHELLLKNCVCKWVAALPAVDFMMPGEVGNLHSICECEILHLDRFELNDLKKLP